MSFLQIPIGTNPNTFLGYEALRSVVITPGSGILNTAFGFNALKSLVSGSRNTAIGNIALRDNQTGDDNTAVGNQVMRIANNAFGNVGVGHQAFYSLTTGSFNVGIGWLSLFGLTTGGNNTAIGQGSGRAITTGSDNSILGGFSGNQGGLDIRTLSNYIVLSDGAGNPRLWIDNTGAANIPGGLALTGSLSITGGTVTANNPVLSATQTWNNAAVTFTGWQLNVTDTASNANSLLMDLQVGGATQFNVSKSGRIGIRGIFGVAGVGGIKDRLGGGGGMSFYNGSSVWGVVSNSGFRFKNGIEFDRADPDSGNSIDATIQCEAPQVLAQRNGVNAQTLRVYNTFTDASNYERGGLSWSSNELVLFTGNAGTGLARNIAIVSAAGINVSAPTSQIGFSTNGLSRWTVANAGHLLAASDNTVDIGASGANRPRNLFLAGNITTGGGLTLAAAGYLTWPGRGSFDAAAVDIVRLSGATVGAALQMSEMTAPAAPAANSVRIYAEDNGSGKTRLMALFASGAAQQIAIEP